MAENDICIYSVTLVKFENTNSGGYYIRSHKYVEFKEINSIEDCNELSKLALKGHYNDTYNDGSGNWQVESVSKIGIMPGEEEWIKVSE